jgi:DNA-binding NarL/FixJ family response regulator
LYPSEKTVRYVADLELLSEQIGRVRELMMRGLAPGAREKEEGRIWEVMEKLSGRVRNWTNLLSQYYVAVEDHFERPGNVVDGQSRIRGDASRAWGLKTVLVGRSILFRRGMKKTLEARPALTVVNEVTDLGKLGAIEGLEADVLVVHLATVQTQDLLRITEVKRLRPGLPVVLIVPGNDAESLSRLARCGADALLLDDSNDQRFLHAVDRVLSGQTYLSPDVSEHLLEGLKKDKAEHGGPGLTSREKEVLKLVAEGRSSKDIAGKLFISVHTVERHRANIMAKLSMNKATDLVKYAISRGLVDAGRE